MKIVLAKTAYSPLLKVAGDYSCGIFDIRRQHGRAGPRPADPSRLDARCGARRRAGLSRRRARRRVHPQRSLSGRLAPARRERRRARLPRRPLARLRLRARALAGHRQRHARQLRRGHRNLRRGPAPAAYPPVSRRQTGPGASRRSSSPMSARPPSASATCARRWRRTGAPAQRLAALAAKYGTDTLLRNHAGGAGLLRNA